MILWERLKENLYSLQARPRNIYISWTAGKDQYEVRFVFDKQMILSAFEKVFGSDYPQRDDFDVVELYEKLYGEGKLPKGDFTIHIDPYLPSNLYRYYGDEPVKNIDSLSVFPIKSHHILH